MLIFLLTISTDLAFIFQILELNSCKKRAQAAQPSCFFDKTTESHYRLMGVKHVQTDHQFLYSAYGGTFS